MKIKYNNQIFENQSDDNVLFRLSDYSIVPFVDLSKVGGGTITGATNGLSVTGKRIKFGGNLTGSTTIGLGTSNLVFTGTTGTVRYGSDLSAQYNVRSHVDKGFVTGLTNNLLLKSSFNTYSGNTIGFAENGLSRSGNRVKLGGTITGDTTINIASSNSFSIVSNNLGQTITYRLDGSSTNGKVNGDTFPNINSSISGLLGRVEFWGVNGTTGIEITRLSIGDAATMRDSRTFKRGIEYESDYSTGYSKNSLVAKRYVTGLTATVQSKSAFISYTGTSLQKLVSTTTYTISNADHGYVIYFTNPSGCLVGIPNLTAGKEFNAVKASGAGYVTFSGGSGVFLQSPGTQLQIDGAGCGWIQKATNEWYGFGSFGLNTNTGAITGATNGLTAISNSKIRLGGNLTGSTTIGLGSNNFVFTASTGTVRYGSDLSAQFNVRSFVDKGFVTGITNTLLTKSSFSTYTGTTANLFASKSLSINSQTSNYTLQIGDAGGMIEISAATTNSISIPAFSAITFTKGTEILLIQQGAGQTTIIPGPGVTLKSVNTKRKLTSQYSSATLIKRNTTNDWYLVGDLTA
jgi:hypothetical protein